VYKLKPRDVERCLFTYKQLLQRRQKRKGFLHRIIIGDKKWIHYDNSKRRRSWDKSSHASISSTNPNIHDSKLLLCIWCMRSAGCSLLWTAQTERNHHERSPLIILDASSIEGKTLYEQRHDKVILQHDSARPHVAQPVKPYLETSLNGKFYSTRCIHSILPLPIITCFDRWHMAWLSSTSIFMKMPKNGSTLR